MRSISLAAKVLSAAALPLALAACSSSTGTAAASGGATSTPSVAKSSADPDAGLLSGAALKAALAPASFFATGFALDATGSTDTGASYQAPSTSAAKPDCTKLDGTSWEALTGISGVSFAQNDYIDKSTTSELAQEIDVFQGTTSQAVMTAIANLATQCPSFTDSQTSSKVKVAGKAVSGLGDGAYVITLTDSAWQSGTTLEAARVGTAVVTVLSSTGSDNGAAAATKLTTQIVTALKGKA